VRAWQPGIPERPVAIANWRNHYQELVCQALLEQGWIRIGENGPAPRRPLILWFYTPTPCYILRCIPAALVVYDVMDELANFYGADRALRWREVVLMAAADIVFTGGRSLYQARAGRHPNVHLFPSGVQPARWRRRRPSTPSSLPFPNHGWATLASSTNGSTSLCSPPWPAPTPNGRS
jgi:hypothetical protein